MIHKSVLLGEAIDGLALKDGEVFVDCTFGAGGHTKEVLRRFGDKVKVIAVDLYDTSYKECRLLSETNPNLSCHKANFRDLDKVLSEAGAGKADAILFDLGWSTDELEHSGRGFSFQKDEPLQMNYSDGGLLAGEVVNSWSEEKIGEILRDYGGERWWRKIAKGIVESRRKARIVSTGDLVGAIERSLPVGARKGKIHFATKTFQALRIAVNDEFGALKDGLEKSFEGLSVGGRIAVISFHSSEDRIVKNFFRDRKKAGQAELLNKKPITAGREEVMENPRARSAKMRIITKRIAHSE